MDVEPGGAVGVCVGVAVGAMMQQFVMTFESSVTAPLRARSRPQIRAVVVSVIEVSARMFPWKAVAVPRVADEPICQNTPQPTPPFVKMTLDPEAVVSVVPILKIQTEAGLPRPLSVSWPVSCAEVEKL